MNYDLCGICDTVQRIESGEIEQTTDDEITWLVLTLACGHSVSIAQTRPGA